MHSRVLSEVSQDFLNRYSLHLPAGVPNKAEQRGDSQFFPLTEVSCMDPRPCRSFSATQWTSISAAEHPGDRRPQPLTQQTMICALDQEEPLLIPVARSRVPPARPFPFYIQLPSLFFLPQLRVRALLQFPFADP